MGLLGTGLAGERGFWHQEGSPVCVEGCACVCLGGGKLRQNWV